MSGTACSGMEQTAEAVLERRLDESSDGRPKGFSLWVVVAHEEVWIDRLLEGPSYRNWWRIDPTAG